VSLVQGVQVWFRVFCADDQLSSDGPACVRLGLDQGVLCVEHTLFLCTDSLCVIFWFLLERKWAVATNLKLKLLLTQIEQLTLASAGRAHTLCALCASRVVGARLELVLWRLVPQGLVANSRVPRVFVGAERQRAVSDSLCARTSHARFSSF
jgi:hypothetical protein